MLPWASRANPAAQESAALITSSVPNLLRSMAFVCTSLSMIARWQQCRLGIRAFMDPHTWITSAMFYFRRWLWHMEAGFNGIVTEGRA